MILATFLSVYFLMSSVPCTAKMSLKNHPTGGDAVSSVAVARTIIILLIVQISEPLGVTGLAYLNITNLRYNIYLLHDRFEKKKIYSSHWQAHVHIYKATRHLDTFHTSVQKHRNAKTQKQENTIEILRYNKETGRDGEMREEIRAGGKPLALSKRCHSNP